MIRLENLDVVAFVSDYWQRRPLLVRNAWADWRNPLAPDELAGLAGESDVESRLVVGGTAWSVEHGPIPSARFGQLGPSDWTLLVQAVDHHVPGVAALIDPFRFVPNWRIDDVMVSYAADRGGVGPHYDQYDVFLVQGLGRRRWRVGARCDEGTRLIPHDDLRLLPEFDVIEEWVLEPGDVLYVPPRFAHEGIAEGGDCMTYSIGFRAPSRRELVSGWCDEVVSRLSDDDRYVDPGLPPQDNPGEISGSALARLHELVMHRIGDAEAFARWFGQSNSSPRYPEIDWSPDEPVAALELRNGGFLERNPASRFSFIVGSSDLVLLFVDGESYDCHGEAAILAKRLCAESEMEVLPSLAQETRDLLAALHNRGSIAFRLRP